MDLPGGCAVYAHGEIVIRFAGFEFARGVAGGHVPLAAHLCINRMSINIEWNQANSEWESVIVVVVVGIGLTVVDVLAVLPGVGVGTSAHAELGSAHEARPF
jgi:hypothetical protein